MRGLLSGDVAAMSAHVLTLDEAYETLDALPLPAGASEILMAVHAVHRAQVEAGVIRRGMEGRTYLERGEPVRVLVRWSGKGPRNVLIERVGGERVVRPFRGLRKVAAK